MADRATVFIDGNNWYHGLAKVGVANKLGLDYAKISRKLLGPRTWLETRYYIGQLSSVSASYSDQRKFVDKLHKTDPRISVHFGRLEPRFVENAAAKEILRYLNGLTKKIDTRTYKELVAIAKKHEQTMVWTEKAVDVQLAVDMVVMATRDEYDCAYLLSADGDFTGAVNYVRGLGKKVFAASPLHGAQIAKAVGTFISLEAAWFGNCYSAPL
jgi:uncharacterized LabA/DUF88 family protein